MPRIVTIDQHDYHVQDHEFVPIVHPQYNNLKLYTDLEELERLVYLVRDLRNALNGFQVGLSASSTHAFGGYLAHQLLRDSGPPGAPWIWVSHVPENAQDESKFPSPVAIAVTADTRFTGDGEYVSVPWHATPYTVHVQVAMWDKFQYVFYRNIAILDLAQPERMLFRYDNLIHLVMIVKNAGPGFAKILEKNIPHIDRWTILDTGSTDNTIQTIQEVLAPRVRGQLFQEPFVDFGTSRNRALELAGDACKFTLMLDDTYYVTGDLRGFLNEIRSDQFADSYSLYINSHDVQYTSNRIVKTQRKLRYIFKIHEVIQEKNNINVIVPPDRAQIHDEQSDYMQTRTTNRKTLDLELLMASIREEPMNPRHWYYMAQTYVCMENYEMAYRFFLARVFHPYDGFLQEKIDACFEAARTAQFRLHKPWSEVEPLYQRAYALDPSRPDAVYFLGIYAYLNGDRDTAFQKFKQAFEIGYPVHAQYSLKPTLSYCYTPKFLTELAYEKREYALGRAAADLYLEKTGPDAVIQSWRNLHAQLERYVAATPLNDACAYDKPLVVFVADGNWNRWSAHDLRTNGLGGSETYIVEMAYWIQRSQRYDVLVFCQCRTTTPEGELHDGVQYLDLQYLYSTLRTYPVHAMIVSRFSEYIPLGLHCPSVQHVFVVVHDLSTSGLVIPMHTKLRQVFTLTEWHQSYFEQCFPQLKPLITPLHYGIAFPDTCVREPRPVKQFQRFIYSSFPNRGLLPLLKMWVAIRSRIPAATLEVYADLDHAWTNANYGEMMREIKQRVHELRDHGVTVHGWVKKAELYAAWQRADVWLYPCIFQETFCLTALEAAASNTLAIAADLAALQNTVGDRGYLVPGDPNTAEWQAAALTVLEQCMRDPDGVADKIRRNREWALAHSWANQARQLIEWIDRPVLGVPPVCVHLVLYSPSEYYTPMYTMTRAYYRRFPTVHTVYYAFREQDAECELEGDVLWIRGTERHTPQDPQHCPGVFEKTMQALAWARKQFGEYAYLVRSNVSTIVDFDVLLPMLARQPHFEYGGAQTLCFPPYDPFVRGICILFSRQLVEAIVDRHFDQFDPEVVDDIGLARLIQKHEPHAYPPQFTFADQIYFVPDFHGDRDALVAAIRNKAYACYRFKVQTFYGVYTEDNHPTRAIDVQQMQWVLECLNASTASTA